MLGIQDATSPDATTNLTLIQIVGFMNFNDHPTEFLTLSWFSWMGELMKNVISAIFWDFPFLNEGGGLVIKAFLLVFSFAWVVMFLNFVRQWVPFLR